MNTTRAFQLMPKRYLGAARMDGRPMQAREIGANDARFQHKQFADPVRLQNAAHIRRGDGARPYQEFRAR